MTSVRGRKELSFRCLCTLLLAVSILLLSVVSRSPLAFSSEILREKISIDNEGVVEVQVVFAVLPGINNVSLPVDPLPGTLQVSLNGEMIAVIYVDGEVIVPAEEEGVAVISYLANVSYPGGFMQVKVKEGHDVSVYLAPNVILLDLPESVYNVTTLDGTLVLRLKGPASLDFLISTTSAETKTTSPASPTTSPIPTVSSETTTELTRTTQPSSTTPSLSERTTTSSTVPPAVGLPRESLIAVIAVMIVALAALLAFKKGLLSRSSSSGVYASGRSLIDLTDEMILKKLLEKGGQIPQPELQKELELPKTTLWRHVKRLEGMGFVEVLKLGNVNVVKITDSGASLFK